MLACDCGKEAAVRVLLSHGARPDLRDPVGLSAAEYAVLAGNGHLVEMLGDHQTEEDIRARIQHMDMHSLVEAAYAMAPEELEDHQEAMLAQFMDSCPFDGMFWSTQPVKLDPSLTGGHSCHVEQGFVATPLAEEMEKSLPQRELLSEEMGFRDVASMTVGELLSAGYELQWAAKEAGLDEDGFPGVFPEHQFYPSRLGFAASLGLWAELKEEGLNDT